MKFEGTCATLCVPYRSIKIRFTGNSIIMIFYFIHILINYCYLCFSTVWTFYRIEIITKSYLCQQSSTIIQLPSYNNPICIQLKPNLLLKSYSYKILASQAISGLTDLQKAAKIILETTGLDPESYRLGNTKACPPSLLHSVLLLCDSIKS